MAHRDERKRSKHKRSKHKKSRHKKHHKKHHKKRRKKTKHHRRKRGRPSGLPSIPTLEQNQYFMMQARVAGLEQQLLAAAKESKPEKKSRAEEVDLLNQVLEEQDRQSRGRDRERGDTGFTPEEARKLIKLGADLSRSARDSKTDRGPKKNRSTDSRFLAPGGRYAELREASDGHQAEVGRGRPPGGELAQKGETR